MKLRLISKIKLLTLINLLLLSTLISAEINVSVRPLSSILIKSKQSAPASVVSLNTSIISAEITGRALKVNAEIGERVEAGQVLVNLDCRSYDLTKKQAEASLKVSAAQLKLTQQQLKRNQKLLKQGTIPRELFENTEASQQTSLADIEVKKVEIQTAKLAIDRCTIKAPFNSQVSQRMVQEGQLLLPGTALFELIETNKIEISSHLPPNSIAVLEGSAIEFVSNKREYKTTIRNIIQRVDENTRTQELRLSLNKEVNLPVGLSGRIQWSNNKSQVPPEYILRNKNELGIMIVEDDGKDKKAKFISLENAIEGQPVIVDLPEKTVIIDKNRYLVADGELINIQEE